MKIVAIDIETTGMDWASDVLVVGAAVAVDDQLLPATSCLLTGADLFSTPVPIPQARAWLQGRIADADWLVLHNASFDLPYLLRLGLLTPQECKGRIFDTLVMAAATAPHESMALQSLCTEYRINGGAGWGEMKALRAKLERLGSAETARYCEQDCVATLQLFRKLWPLAEKIYDREFIAREGDYCALLARMRVNGIQLDTDFIAQRLTRNTARQQQLARAVLFPAGISAPNSRVDLLRWLEQHNWKSFKKTDAGAPCLDEEALTAAVGQMRTPADQEVLQAVVEARGLEKENSTYLSGLLEHADELGRVHPNFFAGGTRTWRLSSNNPNAQNVPRELQHDLYMAREVGGTLVSLDYSQAQLRLAAMYAQENAMARLFADPTTDIHTATAIALFGPEEGPKRRREGKGANFSVLFGSGSTGVAQVYKLSEELAAQVLIEHRRKFPKLQSCSREVINLWRERGYLILPYGKRTWRKSSDPENRAFAGWNYLIQGAEGTIIQKAMLDLDAAGLTPCSQVHDKVYIDVPAGVDPTEVVRAAAQIMADAVPAALTRRTNPPIAMLTDSDIKRRP